MQTGPLHVRTRNHTLHRDLNIFQGSQMTIKATTLMIMRSKTVLVKNCSRYGAERIICVPNHHGVIEYKEVNIPV